MEVVRLTDGISEQGPLELAGAGKAEGGGLLLVSGLYGPLGHGLSSLVRHFRLHVALAVTMLALRVGRRAWLRHLVLPRVPYGPAPTAILQLRLAGGQLFLGDSNQSCLRRGWTRLCSVQCRGTNSGLTLQTALAAATSL